MIFGVNYFPGWWNGSHSGWFSEGGFLLDRFPERTPILGAFSSRQVIAEELSMAAAHGVGFFNFLWYGVGQQTPEIVGPGDSRLGETFSEFWAVADRSPLKFSIEWTNHAPWAHVDFSVWEELIRAWLPIISHPNYVTISGKKFFKIHSWHYWAVTVTDRYDRQAMLGELRGRVRDATGLDMLIGAGVRRLEPIPDGHPLALDGTFDFTSIYADVPNMVKDAPDFMGRGSFNYDLLESHQRAGRGWHAYDVVPFVPNIMVGFRPLWTFQDDLPQFSRASKMQLRRAISAALNDIRDYPGLQFPRDSNPPTGLMMFYSWNEYAEGGFLAPTTETGMSYLDVLKLLSAQKT